LYVGRHLGLDWGKKMPLGRWVGFGAGVVLGLHWYGVLKVGRKGDLAKAVGNKCLCAHWWLAVYVEKDIGRIEIQGTMAKFYGGILIVNAYQCPAVVAVKLGVWVAVR